jgi:hypothetical protein
MKELLEYLEAKIRRAPNPSPSYFDLTKIRSELERIKNTIPDFDKYSDMFLVSIKEQVKRLKENEPYKNGWDNIEIDHCLRKIYDNLYVIDNISTDDMNDDMRSLIYHMADIANYANMAILKCQKIINGEAEYDYKWND